MSNLLCRKRSIWFCVFIAFGAFEQGRRVAITVDDLPYASGGMVASNRSEEARLT